MSEPEKGQSDGVDLSKTGSGPDDPAQTEPAGEVSFDPYRFGKPEHPIPSEYAPPGYTGPTVPSAPAYPANGGYPGPSGYPGATENPFANPPGTPYSPGQQPYPYSGQPYGYGAPPPPPYHGYPQPTAGNGKAIAALVLGILSIVLCWLLFFDAVFVILGLIFGLVALGESRHPGRAGGRGLAIAGLVCTVIGAVLATLLTVLIFHAANQCGGFSNDNSSQFQQCVRDQIFK